MKSNILHILLFASLALLLSIKIGLTLTETQVEKSLTQNTPATISAIVPVDATKAALPAKLPSTTQKVGTPNSQNKSMFSNYRNLLPDVITQAHAGNVDAAMAAPDNMEGDILSGLRKQKELLNEKQQQLDDREKSIKAAEEKLNLRITELEQLEDTIKQRLLDEKNIKNKKIKRLTAVYEGMKPDRAAPVISKLKLSTVVKVFLLMDEKKVGKILSYLPPDKAVQISQALTQQISSVK